MDLSAVGAASSRPLAGDSRAAAANVLTVGADAHIGPRRVSGLSWRLRWLRKAICPALPFKSAAASRCNPPARCAKGTAPA